MAHCKQLTVTVTGPLWVLYEFEIEGINVKSKWKDSATGGSVSVVQLPIDGQIDIYVHLGAPNGTPITIDVVALMSNGSQINSAGNNFTVKTNGKLRAMLSI